MTARTSVDCIHLEVSFTPPCGSDYIPRISILLGLRSFAKTHQNGATQIRTKIIPNLHPEGCCNHLALPLIDRELGLAAALVDTVNLWPSEGNMLPLHHSARKNGCWVCDHSASKEYMKVQVLLPLHLTLPKPHRTQLHVKRQKRWRHSDSN